MYKELKKHIVTYTESDDTKRTNVEAFEVEEETIAEVVVDTTTNEIIRQ